MKKKITIGIILSILLILNLYKVEAYSGELDPENYITLPEKIQISNRVGTGTISLSSSASGYTISYQKVDITESTANNIKNKNKEWDDYIKASTKTLEEKEANVKTLQTEYETLYNSGTATDEELTAAQTKYNEAYQDYQEFYNTVSEKLSTLQNELYSLIPNYTSSWTTTTNSSNNIQLDLKNYSGTIYFILWVKITNGTNTYYDMAAYSSNIKQDETVTISKSSANVKVDETIQLTATSSTSSKITWTSSDSSVATVNSDGLVKGIKEGTAVITAKGSEKSATCTVTVTSKTTTDTPDAGEDTSGDWTDFSNAKFELKKDGISDAIIEISNVTPKEESGYYLFITSNNSKLDVTNDNLDEGILLNYDSDNKIFKTIDSSKVARYVELNQDLYVSIVEEQSYESKKVVIYGKKLERFAEPKYSDAFHATFMSDETDQIVTLFTHAEENNRKIQIKVGKITDNSILQKIKNQDSSGFANLLSFAKSNNGIYNKTVDADKDNDIEYNAGWGTNENSVINLSGLQDDAYYFLYIKTDDENGKYITQEAVTLAQCFVNANGWGLFFYGSEDFKWADFGTVKQDDTVAKGNLPQTGINTIVWITLGIILVGGGAFSYMQYRKNNF